MRLRHFKLAIISLSCLVNIFLAESMELKDGTNYQGAITGASDSTVVSVSQEKRPDAEDLIPSAYLSLRLGAHNSHLGDWEKRFPEDPSTTGIDVGGEMGYRINRKLSLGAGYEYVRYPQVKSSSPGFKDRLYASFVYGSLRISHNLHSKPKLFIYGGGDFGFLNGQEEMKDLEGEGPERFDLAASVLAYRLRIGVEYFAGGSVSLFGEAGYLSANVTDLRSSGYKIENYSLDFGGINLMTGVSFHCLGDM